MITKVVNQQSVTIWFYKINILHSNNNDSKNHFLTIERLLDALSETTPEIRITNKKSGGGAYTGEFQESINDYRSMQSRDRYQKHDEDNTAPQPTDNTPR